MCKARQFVVLKAFFLHEKVDLKISCYMNLSNLQYQNAVVFSASQCILLGFVIYYHQNKANFPNIYWDKLANAEIILTQYNFPTAEEMQELQSMSYPSFKAGKTIGFHS